MDKNATQSAIVSAEVARDRVVMLFTKVDECSLTQSSTIEVVADIADEITFWEQTIKYLNDKL